MDGDAAARSARAVVVTGAAAPVGRAGRNLPAAIAVGVTLSLLVIVPLFLRRGVYVGVVALAAAVGAWELARALRAGGLRVPVPPLVAAAAALTPLAYAQGVEAAVGGLGVAVLALAAWRLAEAELRPTGPAGPASGAAASPGLLADVAAAGLCAVYVCFLPTFAVLLAAPGDGPRRVVAFIATVAGNDIGGYAAGVLLGRHPMAPGVSPKKSWEGFAGSLAVCTAAGLVFLGPMLHQSLWKGVLFGVAVTVCATLGDLGESLLKRDLGIKDMGTMLPGHGGLMDRLDSLLATAPLAWLLLRWLAPVG